MGKSSRHRHRPLALAAIVMLIAVIGLVAIRVGPSTAEPRQDGQLWASETHSGAGVTVGDHPVYPSVVPSLVRLGLALVVVVACIYLGIYLLKQLSTRRRAGADGHHIIEVLETTCVAPKTSVSLIRVADRAVVVGITDSQVSVLTELDATQTAEIIIRENEAGRRSPFADVFRAVGQRIKRLRAGERDVPVTPLVP